jgi:hypothetical protein
MSHDCNGRDETLSSGIPREIAMVVDNDDLVEAYRSCNGSPVAKDEEVSFFEKQLLGEEMSLYVGVLRSHGFVIPS